MRCSRLFPLIWILLLFSTLSYGQAWSGILASNRAIDWSHAGLPATLPDGETTPNPWTPPTRTQCGSTISAGASAATINAALASCGFGHYVLLGAGTFTINNATIGMYAQSGVTLRGSGGMATILNLTGTSQIVFSAIASVGSCTWNSGFSQGATSLTMTSCTGSLPVAGQIINLQECDSGYSGSGCTTGSSTDIGGLYICGDNPACNVVGGSSNLHQQQVVYVTSITGTGPYRVNFTPGLYLPNWASSNSPFVNWSGSPNASVTPFGNGLEDMTVYSANGTDSNNYLVGLTSTYASWVKGVRFVGSAAYEPLYVGGTKNCLVMNNYLFADIALDANYPPAMQETNSSDALVLNNIMASGIPWEGTGGNEGNVKAYNYTRDVFTGYYLFMFEHNAGSAFHLFEGNQTGSIEDDDVHGTHDLNTQFRNYESGWDPPYLIPGGGLSHGIEWDAFARFENAIGNVVGNTLTVNYQSTYSNPLPYFIFQFDGDGPTGVADPLVLSSSLRWGNYDNVSGAVRWCGDSSSPGWSTTCDSTSEIPTMLTGNAAPFNNTVPSTTNLPCSFFLGGYTSTTCTAHSSGGTGLNWWKVCTTWNTFPTTCATTQTQPFPPVGPDVGGGPYLNGYAYDVPASIAFQYLPIDTTYQKPYGITSSGWSGGIETLTVSGLPNTTHLMGGFQISGSACSTGTSEAFMIASTSTTVMYALASDPGSCSGGTMLFPDVRQFDERVYQDDSAGDRPAPPTGLSATVQ